MGNELAIFSYEGFTVRTIEKDGESWFVAKDVCEVLDIINVTQAISKLDSDERAMFNIGRQGDTNIINESGLYSLILTSRKETAKQFKKWVTSDVIPSIRKTGSYSARPEIQIANALVLASQMLEENKKLIEYLQPKADFYDAVTGSGDAIDIGTVAKVLNLGIGRTRMFEFLRDEQILMGNNQPYQRYVDSGYFRVIESSYSKPDGSTHISCKSVVYQKGVDFIRRRYLDRGQQ